MGRHEKSPDLNEAELRPYDGQAHHEGDDRGKRVADLESQSAERKHEGDDEHDATEVDQNAEHTPRDETLLALENPEQRLEGQGERHAHGGSGNIRYGYVQVSAKLRAQGDGRKGYQPTHSEKPEGLLAKQRSGDLAGSARRLLATGSASFGDARMPTTDG